MARYPGSATRPPDQELLRDGWFILPGEPRTKKTSSRIVGMGRKCPGCGKQAIQRLLPSEAFETWFKSVLTYGPALRSTATRVGLTLPVLSQVHVEARIYREADRGDLVGYLQALGDALQQQLYRCKVHNTLASSPCCAQATVGRDGLGLIGDDRQIVSWDGSRLLLDRQVPRIEFRLTVIEEPQGELDLFLAEARA